MSILIPGRLKFTDKQYPAPLLPLSSFQRERFAWYKIPQEIFTGDAEDVIYPEPLFSAIEEAYLRFWIFCFKCNQGAHIVIIYRPG